MSVIIPTAGRSIVIKNAVNSLLIQEPVGMGRTPKLSVPRVDAPNRANILLVLSDPSPFTHVIYTRSINRDFVPWR